MNVARLMLAAALGAVLAGCGQDMTVSVTFEQAGGIESGTPVYWSDVEIGEVSGSTTTGDLVKVELSLDPELAAGLNSGSAALLDTHEGGPAIRLYNYRSGSEPLQGDGELIGLNDSFELAAWRTGEALEAGKQTMDEMTRSVTEYFESEEWRRQKDRMNQSMENMKEELGRTYEETNKAYREFLEDLESESAAARKRAEESYAELVERLREDIARLKEQGNEKIVEPLLRLLEDLSRAMEKKPEQEST